MQQLVQPGDKLHDQRLVEAERGAAPLEPLRRGVVAGKNRGGIARGEAEQEEDEQRHHAHHGHGGENSAKEISEQVGSRQIRVKSETAAGAWGSATSLTFQQFPCHPGHRFCSAVTCFGDLARFWRCGSRRYSRVASSPAISRPRSTRLSTSIYSSSVWPLPPRTPRPSRVGMPNAPVKLPSEPPPALACGSSAPSDLAIPRAFS